MFGTLASGPIVGWAGLQTIVWNNAGLLAVAASVAWMLPNRVTGERPPTDAERQYAWTLLAAPVFRHLMLVVALIGGSHALHDGFEVIRWRSAGLSVTQASVLWSISVAAEVLVLSVCGQSLLRLLGPGRAMMLAGIAGIVRWSAAALTTSFPVMAVVESLHGFTFALLHLACMGVIRRKVPANLAATAQAFYATVAVGVTSAVVMLASGPLYGHLGSAAFWAMALMCATALTVASRIQAKPTAV